MRNRGASGSAEEYTGERAEDAEDHCTVFEGRRQELLSAENARKYIEEYLSGMSNSDICAAIMIDLDNTASLGRDLGYEKEACVESEAEHVLSKLFKAADIVSRIGRDEYLVFVPGPLTEAELTEKAEQICRGMELDTGKTEKAIVTACTGVYIASGKGISFDRLFGQAAAALYEARNEGRGSHCVLTNQAEIEERRKDTAERAISAVSMNTLLEYMDGGVSLLELGPEIRVIYASRGFCKFTSVSPEKAGGSCSLKEIGIHPDYEADYEHRLRENAGKKGIFEHIHRTMTKENKWIWRHVRAAQVSYPGSRYPVMLELSNDISELIDMELRVSESNEMLKVAFGQTPHQLWEVDLKEKTFHVYNEETQKLQPENSVVEFPRTFFEKGIVHPESREQFCEFAEGLLNGKEGASGNFILKDVYSGCYSWFSLSYRMTYDRDGVPVKAVGVESKLPDISGIGTDVYPRRPLPEAVRHHLLVRMKANVTANVAEEVWIHGVDQTAWTWRKAYSDMIAEAERRFFMREEADAFAERFGREHILKKYEAGEYWSSREYRIVDGGGEIRWMSDTVNIVKDKKTDSIHVFACFCDTQQRHDWENLISGEVRCDPVSGLYDAGTAKKMAEALLKNDEGTECALSLVRILGGRKDETGEERERVVRFIATGMAMALGTDCIAGQYRADMLSVFFPRVRSRFDIKRRIEDAFAYVRVSMREILGDDIIRFVAGTVTERKEEADYDVLLFRAGYLCELWKNSAMDTVAFPSEDEDWAWAGLRKDNAKSGITVQAEEMERMLTKEEQAAAFRCVTDMLKSSSREASVMNALRGIGTYYRAARVYVLMLSDDRDTVSMQDEWKENGKQSIRYVMSGVQTDRIPLLVRCLEEKQPIFMETPSAAGEKESKSRWHFTVYPMKKKEQIVGFLCVENAQKHPADVALLGILVPYILGEQRRFSDPEGRVRISGQDTLTMLPNLSSYMDIVYSMDSESYSSMGALSLDIPNFSAINSSFGFEYGRRLLLYISEALVNIFGKAFIFRTWDAEFVVLFPNTIQEVFVGRCTRLRTVIQRRYPRQVRIGSVWADGIFTARNLVREAQTVMRSEVLGEEGPGSVLSGGRKRFPEEGRDGAQKNYVPYFQPKIDMRDGSLVGAEALVRGIDENKNIIPPDQFIEKMEKEGTIRELDLSMLEAVLRQLAAWQEAGLEPVTVSVNISRITLFNPTTLASVLAIQSHYPSIPADQIELEITETAGDMEKATLASIVDDFMECGIRFELDDFGSGYANISVFSNIRFHTIKLDRTLVNDLPGNEISRMLVENITKICRNFDMQCIAEGVETVRQEEALLKAGCVLGQGYYYSRPLPAEEFEKRYLKHI